MRAYLNYYWLDAYRTTVLAGASCVEPLSCANCFASYVRMSLDACTITILVKVVLLVRLRLQRGSQLFDRFTKATGGVRKHQPRSYLAATWQQQSGYYRFA